LKNKTFIICLFCAEDKPKNRGDALLASKLPRNGFKNMRKIFHVYLIDFKVIYGL